MMTDSAKYYFCNYVSVAGARTSVVEKHLLDYARKNLLQRIYSRIEVEHVLERLELQEEKLMEMDRRVHHKRVNVSIEESNGNIYIFMGPFGGNHIAFVPVLDSGKNAAASELFNDGWWNCLETVAAEIGFDRDRILTDAMTMGGVSGTEAYIRAAMIGDSVTQKIVREYADIKYQVGQ